MIRRFIMAVFLLCPAIYCSAQAQSAADDSAGKTSALIEQLADPSFETRQRATEELIAIGAAAEQQITKALKSDDAEVKSRCKSILAGIYHNQIVERRNAFLAGDVDQLKQNVESWTQFEELLGNSEESRKLFVDIQLSYGTLFEFSEDDVQECSDRIDQLCQGKTKELGNGNQEADRTFVAAIAFTGVRVPLEATSLCRSTGKLVQYGKLYGHDDQMLRALLGAWVKRGPTSPLKFRLLYVADAYKLDEAAELARMMLTDPTLSPNLSIKVLSGQGTVADIDLIEPWIWNAKTQYRQQLAGSTIQRSTGDVALATCLKLSGQKLKDYGFVSPDGIADIDTAYGFENDEKRDEARRKWKDFRKTSIESR